jgi:hypothetical protein
MPCARFLALLDGAGRASKLWTSALPHGFEIKLYPKLPCRRGLEKALRHRGADVEEQVPPLPCVKADASAFCATCDTHRSRRPTPQD